jgi:hypothetical protein
MAAAAAMPTPPLVITVPSGLVTYFPLNTINQTIDIIGGHNGTLAGTNTPTGLTGQIAQGLQFNSDGSATTSYMTFGSFQGPQTGASISAWINVPSFPNFGRIIEAGDAATNRYLRLYVGTNGSFAGELCQDPSNFVGRTTNASVVGTGAWHHVVMTWSGGTTDAAIKLYYDNAQVDTFNGGAGTFTAPSSASVPWALGNSGSLVAADNLVGSEDDVRLYNRALSAGEITSIFNAGTAGNP